MNGCLWRIAGMLAAVQPYRRMISIRFKGTLSVEAGGPTSTPLAVALAKAARCGL